jgi:uncharacterized protein YeeX (DUF496 family)
MIAMQICEGPELELMQAILREIDNSEVNSVLTITQILANVMAYVVKDAPLKDVDDYIVMFADITCNRLQAEKVLRECSERPN